jgi:hypothetical protein
MDLKSIGVQNPEFQLEDSACFDRAGFDLD